MSYILVYITPKRNSNEPKPQKNYQNRNKFSIAVYEKPIAFSKAEPRLVHYKNIKLSTLKVLRLAWEMLQDFESSKVSLGNASGFCSANYDYFNQIFTSTLDQHARMRTLHPYWAIKHACAHYIHIGPTRTHAHIASTLDQLALKKKKWIRGNHKTYE